MPAPSVCVLKGIEKLFALPVNEAGAEVAPLTVAVIVPPALGYALTFPLSVTDPVPTVVVGELRLVREEFNFATVNVKACVVVPAEFVALIVNG